MSEENNVADIFGNGRPIQEKPPMHHHLERMVAKMQGFFADDMAGVVVIAVGRDGKWSLGFRVESEDAIIGSRMLAGMAMAAITEEMIVKPQLDELGISNDQNS